MAKFYPYETNKGISYEYTYEEFLEHLRGDHEIFLKFNGIKIAIYPTDKYVLRVGETKYEFVSKQSILMQYIVPGKLLKDIWDEVEILDVF